MPETLLARVQKTPPPARKPETLRARVQYAPPLALAMRSPLARVRCTPPLALAMRSPLARVRCTPPLALALLGASLNCRSIKIRLHFSICALAILSQNGHGVLLLLFWTRARTQGVYVHSLGEINCATCAGTPGSLTPGVPAPPGICV